MGDQLSILSDNIKVWSKKLTSTLTFSTPSPSTSAQGAETPHLLKNDAFAHDTWYRDFLLQWPPLSQHSVPKR